MSNAIGRLRTLGIAKQNTFNTAVTTATFVLPLTNAPQFNPQIQKVMNEASFGSAYRTNDMEWTNRMTEVPLEFKIDEDHLPLFFSQRFTISSGTVTGDANAYEHVLSYSNNTNNWFTLFLQDDNRKDYIVKNALFGNLDITFDTDFVRASATLMGNYPEISTVTNTIVQPKEFVGRMVNYQDVNAPGTVTATEVLNMNVNFEFGINDDASKYNIGSGDLSSLVLTSDDFNMPITRLKPNTLKYEDHENLTAKESRVIAENTDRFIDGTTITRPTIQIDVPRGKMEEYTEEPDLDELVRENYTLKMLKPAGVSGTPCSLTIKNNVASY